MDLADSFTILLRKESTVYPADMAKKNLIKCLTTQESVSYHYLILQKPKASMINPLTYKKIRIL